MKKIATLLALMAVSLLVFSQGRDFNYEFPTDGFIATPLADAETQVITWDTVHIISARIVKEYKRLTVSRSDQMNVIWFSGNVTFMGLQPNGDLRYYNDEDSAMEIFVNPAFGTIVFKKRDSVLKVFGKRATPIAKKD